MLAGHWQDPGGTRDGEDGGGCILVGGSFSAFIERGEGALGVGDVQLSVVLVYGLWFHELTYTHTRARARSYTNSHTLTLNIHIHKTHTSVPKLKISPIIPPKLLCVCMSLQLDIPIYYQHVIVYKIFVVAE